MHPDSMPVNGTCIKEYPQHWLPAFTARCVSFVGNSIEGTEIRDKSGDDDDGNS